jgi:hypothetical protein
MAEYFTTVSDTVEFRQGDIIRQFHDPVTRKNATWGFIVNADCDLVNKKNQGHLSWLEIIPASQYWADFWAPQQLEKLADKQAFQICDQINSVIKKAGIKADKIDFEKLKSWTARESPAELVSSLGVENHELEKSIEAFKLATQQISSESALDVLERCQNLLGQDPTKNLAEFQKFIVKQEGFPDFFLVPNLPEGDAKGYIVLLRRVRGGKEASVYKTGMDARINDEPSALHRVGRFTDGVRFQVVQKMAFLFSRIGSPEEFENDCKQVIEWTIEERKPRK